MDPLSIIGAVTAAGRVTLTLSTTLFTFIGATRNVDHTIRALYEEVKGLVLILDAIGSNIKTLDVGKGKQPEQHPDLWTSVTALVENCRGTVDLMCQTLQGVKRPGSNIAGQAFRVFKLNWKEDTIKTLRSQIQTHAGALQLALQMIIMVNV